MPETRTRPEYEWARPDSREGVEGSPKAWVIRPTGEAIPFASVGAARAAAGDLGVVIEEATL